MSAQLGLEKTQMSEFKPTTPRLKAAPMLSNPEIGIGIGEKGGISLYVRGQRFPVTLYYEQWDMVLQPEVVNEIHGFAVDHAELLATRPVYGKDRGKPQGGFTIDKTELGILDTEIAKLTTAGDVPGAVKYATIKSIAELGGKVTNEQMFSFMELKVRK
jgi:hypothetical protein